MGIGRTVAIVGALAGIGLAVYGYFEGVPESDIVYAVRGHDLPKVKQLLERDPKLVHVKVYPQAYERASQRLEYETRHSRSPWEGKYLMHEAADNGGKDAVALLDMLAAAGAEPPGPPKGTCPPSTMRPTVAISRSPPGSSTAAPMSTPGTIAATAALNSDGRRCTTLSTFAPAKSANCCSREALPSTKRAPTGAAPSMSPRSGRTSAARSCCVATAPILRALTPAGGRLATRP